MVNTAVLEIASWGFESLYPYEFESVVKLVNTIDLKSIASAYGFKSLHSHDFGKKNGYD
jgi:hypothetical protein